MTLNVTRHCPRPPQVTPIAEGGAPGAGSQDYARLWDLRAEGQPLLVSDTLLAAVVLIPTFDPRRAAVEPVSQRVKVRREAPKLAHRLIVAILRNRDLAR